MPSDNKINYCWLDCDPGHDDAFALLLAAFAPNIEIVGVSTVAGNQTLDNTTHNTLKLLALFGLIDEPTKATGDDADFTVDLDLNDCATHGGLRFPVVRGAHRSILRVSDTCSEIHGSSGMDTLVPLEYPPISKFAQNYVDNLNGQDVHFTTWIYRRLKQAPAPVTIIATGPLTNVAMLLMNYPDCGRYIDKIVFMGGAIGCGNHSPNTEFNIYTDPEAAQRVLDAGVPTYMVPLEVTHTAQVSAEVLRSVEAIGSPLARILAEHLRFIVHTNVPEITESPALHDPCAVAFVVEAAMFESTLCRVDVETSSALSTGQTVCDLHGMMGKAGNVHVCTRMDVGKFWAMVVEAARRCDAVSPANRV